MAFSAAYQVLSPFRRHNRLVHYSGYAAGVCVWLLAYNLVGSFLTWFGWPSMAVATTVACIVSGLFMGLLFTEAIGSPGGNVLLPAAVTMFVPRSVYAVPFPEATVVPSWDLTFLGISVVGIYAGAVAASVVVSRRCRQMPRPFQWEADVMPYSVRLFDGSDPDADSSFDPRIEGYPEIEFDLVGAAVGLIVVMPVAAVGLHVLSPYFAAGDDAIEPLMAAIFFAVVQWVRLE